MRGRQRDVNITLEMARNPRLLLLVTVLAACAREPETAAPPEAANVHVVPAELALTSGESAQLSAEVGDATGEPIGGAHIEFRSHEPGIATVTEHGRVTAAGPVGTTFVRVMSGAREVEVPVRVSVGAPARVEKIAGDAQSAPVGSALPEPLAVRVTDAARNPVANVTVRFAPPESGTTIEAQTDADGRASAVVKLGAVAGPGAVGAGVVDAPEAASTFSYTALPGPPAQLTRAESEGAARPAAGAPVDMTVRVADEHGNPVPDVEVQWSVATGGGAIEPQTSRTDAAGLAATRWITGSNPGENRLLASVAASDLEALALDVTTEAAAGTE